MSSSDLSLKKLLHDKRLTEWMVNNGHLSKEDLKKYLDSLPDLSGKIDLLRMGEEKNRGETH